MEQKTGIPTEEVRPSGPAPTVRPRNDWRTMPPALQMAVLLLVVLGLTLAMSLLLPLVSMATAVESPIWARLFVVAAAALVMSLVALPFLSLLFVALIGTLNRRPWGWWMMLVFLGLFVVVQSIVFLLGSLERPTPIAVLMIVQIGLAVTLIGFLLARPSRSWFLKDRTDH